MVHEDAVGLEKVQKSLIFKGKPSDFGLARVSLNIKAVSPDLILFRSSIMKKTILALSLAALSVPALAQGKKPEPEYTITGNVGVFSDYRFRGISQTRLGPALQGGFDLAHKSGFYLGNWNSNVSSDQFWSGAGLEIDLYGGYKTTLAGIGLDVGTIYYYYPNAGVRSTTSTRVVEKYDNHEVYFGLSYGPLSFKTSYAVSDYFGLNSSTDNFVAPIDRSSGGSSGTMYYDLTLSKEIADKLTLSAHIGSTKFKNYGRLDYEDYKIGVTYDLDGWLVGLSYFTNSMSTADAKTFTTSNANATGGTITERKLYKDAAVISISKTF